MAKTPYPYGRFIGRVGALAVALGVGAAIASSPGIAFADTGESSSSESSAANSGEGAGTAGTSPGSNPSPPTSTDNSTGPGAGHDADDPDVDDSAADGSETDGSVDEQTGDAETGDEDDQQESDEEGPADSDPTPEPEPDETPETGAGSARSSSGYEPATRQQQTTSQSVTTDHDDIDDIDDTDDTETPEKSTELQTNDAEPPATAATRSALAAQDTAPSTHTTSLAVPTASTTVSTPLATGFGGIVSSVLSALGFGPQAASGTPATPAQPPALWALLGWVRREIGHMVAPLFPAAATETTSEVTQNAVPAVSPLATPEQLEAERLATATANSLPVTLMKIFLRQGFLAAANQHFPGGPDEENLAALDRAVDEYAMGAAFQQLLLNPLTPTIVTQVAPPHTWFGQAVGGSRILYDNPDTIYRFMSVSASSEYEIRGQFHDLTEDGMPTDVSFSVLEGLQGTTSTILTLDDLEVNDDGSFVITVSADPADGRPNHLQLTPGSTILAARDTLGNWNDEVPMSLSIERVGGPPNSLFAQIGGFTFLGPQVSTNPLLTTLVSLVPPLPYMPPVLRGTFTALILLVRGVNEQSKYMALATTDPQTGEVRPANDISQPSSNAEFLANQLQSSGYYELGDDEALVFTIDPGRANYFIVPTYNIWTITDDYWNEPTSLNIEQAIANDDGTYTFVISPTDPGATNWVSTGGLNQGAISIRFQDLGPDVADAPRIFDQQVVSHDELSQLPGITFVTPEERAEQLALRKAGFDNRWAPFPQA